MKPQTISTLLLITLLNIACNNTDPNPNDLVTTDSSSIVSEITPPEMQKEKPLGNCLDWEFAFDGPDDEVLLISACEMQDGVFHFYQKDEEDLNSTEVLTSGASFYQLFGQKEGDQLRAITGKVIGYYRNGRKMTEIDLQEGSKSGLFVVSDESGKVLVYRDHSQKGPRAHQKELYPHRWSFDTSMINLTVNAKEFSTEDGQKIVNLSFIGNQERSDFYTKRIWDKAPLKINGELFTGTLRGYTTDLIYNEHELDAFKQFEIELKDGLLHGHFNLWDPYMGHELDEVFEKGVLKETLFKLNPEDMDGMAKPVIYLYPEKEQVLNVKLNLKGKLVHPYPRYDKNKGWNVLAKPNGQLTEVNSGKEFYCLYWEGLTTHQFDLSTGFVVKGSESIEFLEKTLAQLGLNRREANEMIIYWLPRLEKNPYNLIHFSFETYEKIAKLKITPQPDQTIRVMMVFKGLEKSIHIEEQVLPNISLDRKGFTAVEWGGQEVRSHHKVSSPIF